ncbi:hypothetical protein P8452_01964 [Trifolium repens]|nr:hypothetical protein P8452_01964 [Trifolium repens]
MDPKSVKEFPERHTDDEENTELKMKLNESEKNIVKLKENVEELSLEKSQLMERLEELIEENSKLRLKKDTVEKLKAKIEKLNSEIAKRDEISLQCSSTLLGTIRRLKAANVMDENVNIPSLFVHRKIYKMKTISEILDMAASGNNMSVVYHCVATVDDILVKNGWYYVSCSECRKKWSPTKKDQCEHCKVDVAYPKNRFRLELQVKDPTDSTIFVLFDEVVEQVVQVKCGDLTSNLENGNVKDSELPREILNIIGTKHVFQVKMSSYFETPGRQSFTPNKILKSIVKVDKEDTMDYICSSSSGPPTVNVPILAQKRKRLILHSLSESDNMDQNIVQDLDD